MRKRLTAAFLCLCLLFTLLPATAFAEGEPDSGPQPAAQSALCEHHPSNDESCGYTEGTEGSPCTHQHDEDCYIFVTECVHEHGPECYPEESVSENTATPSEPEEAEPSECTHECSEESGCMTRILDCKHEHKVNGGEADREGGLGRDEACGYVSATEGTPCTFVCEVCNAQDSGNPATPSDAQPEECTCENLCTDEEINADCPVCSAEGAELDKVCVGVTPMLPVMALAVAVDAPQTLYVAGQVITDEGYYTQSGNSWTKSSDTSTPPSAPYFHYTKGDNNTPATLTLSGATIQGGTSTVPVPYGAGIYARCKNRESVSLTIELIGNNTITGYYGIYMDAQQGDTLGANASLNITGDGSLTVTNTDSHGLFVKGGTGNASLNIEKATVTSNTNNSYAAGVYVMSSISANLPTLSLAVNGGSLTASGGTSGDGIQFVVGSSQATGATTNLTVTDNAIVDARNGGISASRISETLPTPTPTGNNSSGIVFDGSTGTVYGEVTLDESLTINQGETLTVPDGSSLNCNDKLTNSGTIIVEAGGKLDGTPTGTGTVIDKSSPVSYLDENGTEQRCNDYEVVTENDTQWTTGWYVVNSDVTINQRIPVNGDVKLILTDGHTLTVNGGIHVTGNNCFTVYGQENGNGKLTATATNHEGAGIGGNGSTTTSAQDGENGGTIVIAGGIIEAVGGDSANDTDSPCGGAGIGNGKGASNGGSVTIYGGEVNATGGAANAGIGGDGSTIQILGGTVDATTSGGAGAAAIGGTNGAAGTITITESNVTANGKNGTGIGSGWEDHGGTITITNSTVTAIGGYGAGIGGGSGLPGSAAGGNGGKVTIVNSTVTASSKEGDSIGAGQNGTVSGTLTLSPADSKAIAAKAGADEASALTLNGSPFTTETAVTDLVRGTKYFHSEPCSIYAVTVNDSYAQTTGAGNYAEGATVAIDAGTRSGYTFDGWTSADGVTFANAGSTQTTFTMPDKAVTVTANWTKKSTGGGGGGGSSYDYYTISATAGEGGSISPAGNISVREGLDKTFTISPAGGYAISDVRVDGVSVGAVTSYTFDNVRTGHTIEAVFTKENPDTGNPFTDVHPDDWFYNDVMFVYQNGLMTGTSATTFEPNTSTTRAMIVAMLARLENVTDADSAGFTDVADGDWYATAVNWAASEGIVNGYSDTAFGPNDAITREQMAAILMNYAEYKGQDVSARADLSGYTDAADISAWAEDSMSWAVAEGLLKGVTADTLEPQGAATRAQVAAILQRFLSE